MRKILSFLTFPVRFFWRASWKLKLGLIILVLIIAGIISYQIQRSQSGSGIKTEPATLATVTEIVSESGIVSTDGRVNVYSPTRGIVQELPVANDQLVEEGEVLFIAKSTATDQDKALALANYQSAVAQLQIAKNTLRDRQATADNVLDSVKDNDDDENFTQRQARTTAEAARDSAVDGVKSAQAQVNATSIAYQATQNATVRAPIGGRVVNLGITTGSNVYPNTSPGESPALIIDNTTITEVVLAIGENDISKVRVGQTAEIVVEALKNQKLAGIVTKVDHIGTSIAQVMQYKVYLQVTNPNENLRPGMAVDVDIITNQLNNVLTVPNSAVKPFEGGRGVRIPTDQPGETKMIPVEVGIKGEDRTQIISGLSEGQLVVSALSNAEAGRKGPFGF